MRKIRIGQKFGSLKVTSADTGMLTPKGKKSHAYVICECSCGESAIVIKGKLFKGERKTCGKMECKYKNWKNKKYTTKDGYKLVAGTRGKFEHRLVMETKLRRTLTKEEVVHHINGVKTDNRIENLIVLARSEHSYNHCETIRKISGLLRRVELLEKQVCVLMRENIKLSTAV